MPCLVYLRILLRQEADGSHPQGKATGDSVSINKLHNKKRKAIEARMLGPAQTMYFSFWKSGDLPNHIYTERLLGGQRGVMSRDILSRHLFGKIYFD